VSPELVLIFFTIETSFQSVSWMGEIDMLRKIIFAIVTILVFTWSAQLSPALSQQQGIYLDMPLPSGQRLTFYCARFTTAPPHANVRRAQHVMYARILGLTNSAVANCDRPNVAVHIGPFAFPVIIRFEPLYDWVGKPDEYANVDSTLTEINPGSRWHVTAPAENNDIVQTAHYVIMRTIQGVQ
jgi:hypothetical protein